TPRRDSPLGPGVGFAEYGYGLGNVPFPDKGVPFRGHNGGIDSFTSVYGYARAANAGYVLLANGGEGVDIARPAARLVQEYLTRDRGLQPPPTVSGAAARLGAHPGFYRPGPPRDRPAPPHPAG